MNFINQFLSQLKQGAGNASNAFKVGVNAATPIVTAAAAQAAPIVAAAAAQAAQAAISGMLTSFIQSSSTNLENPILNTIKQQV